MKPPIFAPHRYFDLDQTEHKVLFKEIVQAWDVLPKIGPYLHEHLKPGNEGNLIGQPLIGPQVFIGEDTVIEPGAYIKGPAWIGAHCQIRHGAYIRENVIIGDHCVIGNSCEIKNSLLFNHCQVPHFNYVGDSVLGTKVHLAAGVIVSNLKLNGDFVTVNYNHALITTGLRKFGAIIGDHVEVGCNAVLNPGSILGRHSLVYPCIAWRGVLPENSIAKRADLIEQRH